MPKHFGGGTKIPLTQRVRDVTVAEAVAAAAGLEEAPDLLELSPLIIPTVPLQPRPPLASSGYLVGNVGAFIGASALNFTNVGVFGSGVGRAIVRVNWIIIHNNGAGALGYRIRRLDAPFTGFTSTRAAPGYINAGNPTTGGVFLVTRNDDASVSGVNMAEFGVPAASNLRIPGPWILNDGALLVSGRVINQEVRAMFGWEMWPAIRVQPPGG